MQYVCYGYGMGKVNLFLPTIALSRVYDFITLFEKENKMTICEMEDHAAISNL